MDRVGLLSAPMSLRFPMQETPRPVEATASVLQLGMQPCQRKLSPENHSLLSRHTIAFQNHLVPPILQVNPNDDFIERVPNVPQLSKEYSHYGAKLEDLHQLCVRKKTREALKACSTFSLPTEDSDSAYIEIIKFVNSIMFVSLVQHQRFDVFFQLPATNSREFINWLLDIATASSEGTKTIPASADIILFCLRWAADAGSQRARQILVKCLLFGEIDPFDPESRYTFHYFPSEAVKHLMNMAMAEEQLPIAFDYHEWIINQMVGLIQSRSDLEKKEDLAKTLLESDYPEIKLLVPLLYTNVAFGTPDVAKAEDSLNALEHQLSSVPEQSTKLQHIHQFWGIVCAMAKGPLSNDNRLKLQDMATSHFLAAVHLLCEYCLEVKEYARDYVTPLIHKPHASYLEYPDLAYSLYCFFNWKKALQEPKKMAARYQQETEMNTRRFFEHAAFNAHSGARAMRLYESFKEVCNDSNFRNIRTLAIKPVDQSAIEILHQSRFSQDVSIHAYTHCAQVLRHGIGDYRIIEQAQLRNPFLLYYFMLTLSDSTESMDSVNLVNELLNLSSDEIVFLRMQWAYRDSFFDFLERLSKYASYSKKAERCFQLKLNLIQKIAKLSSDNQIEYEGLAREKVLQNKPEEAAVYYEKAWDLTDPYFKQRDMKYLKEGVEEDYQVIRKDLPEAYLQLNRLSAITCHPLEIRYRHQQFMELWKKIQPFQDPSLHYAWVKNVLSLITYSYVHLELIQCALLIVNCVKSTKHSEVLIRALIHSSIDTLDKLAKNFAVENPSQDMSVLFDGVTRMRQKMSSDTDSRNEGIAEQSMAKLPGKYLNSHTKEHHLAQIIPSTSSADKRLSLFQSLLPDKHDFDSPTFIRMAATYFVSPEKEHVSGIADVLHMLGKALESDVDKIKSLIMDLNCETLWALHVYIESYKGAPDKIMARIEKIKEELHLDLAMHHPESLIKTRKGRTEKEKKLYELLEYYYCSTEELF